MMLKRHLDLYTYGDPVELKSRFWSWYQRALKGVAEQEALSRVYRTHPYTMGRRIPRSTSYSPSPITYGLPVTHRSGTPRSYPRGFFSSDVAPYHLGAGVSRDPWWWSFPGLRPYLVSSLPVRNYTPPHSYLSPVKRNYVWTNHPRRPYSYRWFY